jgi:DnaJ-domain-containing protein 1
MEAIEGPLWEGVLPGVLRELFVGRKTGVLSFRLKDERRSVRFRGGNIVSADSSVPEEWMGEMLVRQGRLSRDNLKRAVGFVLRDKRRLGVVLQELGFLDADGLEEAVGDHVKAVLGKVFSWSDGSYQFEEEPDDRMREGDVTLRLSTGELILEAARSVSDPDVVRFNLGDIDQVLALSNDPLLRFQRISLSPADGYVLSRVDGALTARELGMVIPLPEEQFHRSLFGLLSAGVVDLLPAPPKTRLAPAPGAAEPAAADVSPADREATPVEEAPPPADVAEATMAPSYEDSHVAPVPEAPPPGQSVVEQTMIIPSPGELPDEMPSPGESAVEKTVVIPPPGQSAAEKTMIMPPPGLSAAEKTVIMPPPGLSAAEKTVIMPPPAQSTARKTVIAPPPGESAAERTMIMQPLRELPIGQTMAMPTLSSEPGGTPPELSDAEKTQKLPPVETRRLEVLEAYENLAARTHFEVLGVPGGAKEAQVREAYFRLAKRFHPDVHHDPALSDLREQLEEIFGRLGEAYEVLCSPRLRARYEKLLAEQVAAPRAPVPRAPEEEAALAAEAIEKGAASIAQERYSEAIQQLEPAISRARGEARSRGRVLLARAYAEHPNWVKQGEELLLSVLLEEPENDEALLLLGRIYAGLGLRSRSVATLGRVLDRHPGHEEARGLIKEIERVPLSSGEGAGRLKKLLGWKPS